MTMDTSMSIEFTIRKMRDDDLAGVAEVEAGVFTDWYRVHRRDPEPLPERTVEELRYATSIDPDGNLVALSPEGAIVGFILARSWGSVGWFGTFGVPTQFQGLGIGRALVACTVEHLRSRASMVGLETMPESGANIGLYARSGFDVTFPTVILESVLEPGSNAADEEDGERLDTWSSLDKDARQRVAGQMREIGDGILPGLDYTPEVEAIERHQFGETLLCLDGPDLAGFAVLRTAPFRKVERHARGYVHALALRPGCDRAAVMLRLLDRARSRCLGAGLTRLVAGVSTRYPDALGLFYSNGFRSQRTAIRMVDRSSRPDIFERSSEVNSSRWVG